MDNLSGVASRQYSDHKYLQVWISGSKRIHLCVPPNGISIIPGIFSLCFPLLTVFTLVDDSEFARCWLFKSGRSPSPGRKCLSFLPASVETNFFEQPSEPTHVEDKHGKVSPPCLQRLPLSSYHNSATTSHNPAKFTILKKYYLIFRQTFKYCIVLYSFI